METFLGTMRIERMPDLFFCRDRPGEALQGGEAQEGGVSSPLRVPSRARPGCRVVSYRPLDIALHW